MLKKVVTSHIWSHLSSNFLSFSQYDHGIFHSPETILFKIHNDLDLVMDRGDFICIPLDLFATFDTVDHSSFSLVFTTGSVLMAFPLICPHRISHLVLRQSQSMIPSLHPLLFPVVYPKVPFFAHCYPLGSMISRNSLIYTVSFVCWGYPALHLFHFNESCSISWNAQHHFHCHSLLDELELTAPQSIKNWIPCYWQKTSTSPICSSHKLWTLSNDK